MTASAFLSAQGIKVVLAGRIVLNDVSLSLPSGHLVALVGPNGAGKTTLLRALAGLFLPPAPSMSAATRCRRLPCANAHGGFAYLPQGHIMHWPLPARDIVALGRYPHGATDPVAFDAERCRGGVAGDAGDRCHGIQRAPRH